MRVLLLCAAAFAAGLLASTLFWPESRGPRGRAPQESTSSQGSAAAARDPERRADAPEGDEPVVASALGRNADVRTLADEAAVEIERIKRSERAEALLSGNGTVTGAVRDPSGKPVEGVVVTALPEARPAHLHLDARWARERPHLDRDLRDVAGDAIEGELWRRDARRTARTGADGRFEIGGLMDAGHMVTAFHEDYDVQPLSQRGRVQPDAVVDFLAQPVVEVRVEVRMPDGTPPDYAWLRWEGPHGSGSDAWSQDRATVRLPAESSKVKAQTWLPEPMESADVEHVPGSGDVLVLQLEGRRVLTARLVLPEDFVLPRTVEYRLRRLVDRGEVDPESLLKDESQRHASTPSPGRAYWYDLEPGRYLVAAFLDRRRLIAHAVAEVGDGPAEVELQVDDSAVGAHVTVKLLGPDGGPVPGQASFRVLGGTADRPKVQRADALQRGDGAWLVLLDGIDPGGDRTATLRVGTRDYGAALHPIRLDDVGTITLKFDEPARLRLHLDRYNGSGVEGSLYAALRSKWGADAYKLVSADGNCDLSGVQPGPYGLELLVRRNNRTWSIFRRMVDLDPGDEERSVAVPALHALRVRWTGRGRMRAVRLLCTDERVGRFRREATFEGGVATFDALAAGTYDLECAGKRVTVRVPAAEVTFE